MTKKKGVVCFKVIQRHSAGGNEANHKEAQVRWQAFDGEFKPSSLARESVSPHT
jgi:hypothetical protein